ncbi:hypothetical protein D3C73_905290 [compost metagenome]
MLKPNTLPVRAAGVIFLTKMLTEGISPAAVNPKMNRSAISCQGVCTKACGINRTPAASSAPRITRCAPIRSDSLPSLGAAIMLASPEAENARPEMSAI